MMFYERALAERKRLEEEHNTIRKKLESAPEGILRCKRDGNAYKWFHRIEGTDGKACTRFLAKRELEKARKLAFKTYYLQRMKDNEQELAAIDAYLKRNPEGGGKAVCLKQNPAFAELLQTEDLEKELENWKKEKYEKNPNYTDRLTVRATTGEMVRSKSEAFILSALAAAGIPYRYECGLMLGSATVYPDFTLRRPSDGQLVLWEHFGLMSDPAYLKSAQDKIQKYIAYGFYPMENLITTFEREGSTLDFSRVMDLVEWIKG